jgi:hypothetical protein
MDVTSYLLGKNAGGGSEINNQNKNITITQNGNTSVTADTGYTGLGTVDITTNVGGGVSDYFLANTQAGYNGLTGIIKKIPTLDIANTPYFSFSNCVFLEEIEGITGTSNRTSGNQMFYECNRLKEIPYFDTSNFTTMEGFARNCNSLSTIPLFDTSNVTAMNYMLACTNEGGYDGNVLTYVPLFNTSKVTSFTNMFQGRKNMNDEALDNILQMCIGATSYTGTKTLGQLGIYSNSGYSASRIRALPHYQDFVNAGWTIGY